MDLGIIGNSGSGGGARGSTAIIPFVVPLYGDSKNEPKILLCFRVCTDADIIWSVLLRSPPRSLLPCEPIHVSIIVGSAPPVPSNP